jgi:hypothetical protein
MRIGTPNALEDCRPLWRHYKHHGCAANSKLMILPTLEAVQELKKDSGATNAVLHVTC